MPAVAVAVDHRQPDMSSSLLGERRRARPARPYNYHALHTENFHLPSIVTLADRLICRHSFGGEPRRAVSSLKWFVR